LNKPPCDEECDSNRKKNHTATWKHKRHIMHNINRR
jgi:hypothetical protein